MFIQELKDLFQKYNIVIDVSIPNTEYYDYDVNVIFENNLTGETYIDLGLVDFEKDLSELKG